MQKDSIKEQFIKIWPRTKTLRTSACSKEPYFVESKCLMVVWAGTEINSKTIYMAHQALHVFLNLLSFHHFFEMQERIVIASYSKVDIFDVSAHMRDDTHQQVMPFSTLIKKSRQSWCWESYKEWSGWWQAPVSSSCWKDQLPIYTLLWGIWSKLGWIYSVGNDWNSLRI